MPVDVTLAPQLRGTISVYPIPSALPFGVDAFVTDRFGGVSDPPYDSLNLAIHVGDRIEDVLENRQRVAEAADVDPAHLVTTHQVHGASVLVVDSAGGGLQGDGLVTSTRGLALAILVADCLPILLVDESSTRFGVIHAGWRGLAEGVVASAVEHFARPSTLHAFIGPGISVEGYQVGPEVASNFTHVAGAVLEDRDDRSRLDLGRVAAAQLLALGLAEDHIELCTQSTDGGEVFFSDRARRPCGRFALVAQRSSSDDRDGHEDNA